jgi:hypothetical protein
MDIGHEMDHEIEIETLISKVVPDTMQPQNFLDLKMGK